MKDIEALPLLLGFLTGEETSHHIIKALKQSCGKVLVVRNSELLLTTSLNMPGLQVSGFSSLN